MAVIGARAYEQWAAGLVEVLDRAAAGGDREDDDGLAARKAEFRSALVRLIAEAGDPLSVGIVGEFSAGKSLLLEALVGVPDLLSVSDVPTTGNVTAIQVTQSAEGERTPVVESRDVVYCTHAEALELMRHLHQELVPLAALENLTGRQRAGLAAAGPTADGWRTLVAWCEEDAGGVLGDSTRTLMAEIRRFDAAYGRGAALLGRRFRLSGPQAKRAMSLPGVRLDAPAAAGFAPTGSRNGEAGGGDPHPGHSPGTGFPATGPGSATVPGPGTTTAPGPGPRPGHGSGTATGQGQAQGSASLPGSGSRSGAGDDGPPAVPGHLLAECVPLIRRVDIRIRVPRTVWNLGEAGALALLDFPGLNSPESGQRDRFLSRRELRDVHTVLVLINSHRGPVSSEQDFFDMLREPTADGRERRPDDVLRESLLVACGRFDELRVDPAAVRPALLDTPEPLTEQRLLGLPRTAVLDTLVKAAYRLPLAGHEKQLTLASAVLGMGALAEEGAIRLDQDFRTRLGLGRALAEAGKAAELWDDVARRLDADDPGTPLAGALRDFAADGGLRRLRDQLTRHARDHGGAIRRDAVRRRAAAADKLRLALAEAEREAGARSEYPPLHQEIQEALADTRSLLTDLRDSLVLGIRHDGPDGTAEGGSGAAGTGSPDDEARRRIRARAAYLVAGWPQWKHLFGAVERDHQLITPRSGDPAPVESTITSRAARLAREMGLTVSEEPGPADAGPGVPMDPDALFPSFLDCHESLLGFVRGQALAEFERRLEQHADTMAELFDRWEHLVRHGRPQGSWTPRQTRRLVEILAFTDIETLGEHLGEAPSARTEAADVQAAYPLRRDRAFAWHPDAPADRDSLGRHVVHAVRMRRELVTALVHLVHGHLAKEVSELGSAAEAFITGAERRVNDPQTLDLLLSDAAESPAGPRPDESLELAARLDAMPSPAATGTRGLRRTTTRSGHHV